MKRNFKFPLSTFLVLTSMLLVSTNSIKSNSANTNSDSIKIEKVGHNKNSSEIKWSSKNDKNIEQYNIYLNKKLITSTKDDRYTFSKKLKNNDDVEVVGVNKDNRKVYSARAPVAELYNYSLENLTDTGFDIVVQIRSDEPIRNIHLPVWKSGAYEKHSYYTATKVPGTSGTFKARVNFGEIGSGSEYINVGVHPVFESLGYSTFLADAVLKIDTTTPNLSLNQNITEWTSGDVTIHSTSNDDMNIVENMYFYDKNNNMKKIEKFSNPKILLVSYSETDNIEGRLKSDGYSNITSVPLDSISNTSQLKGYDIVIIDCRYWGLWDNTGTAPIPMLNILNQAFREGVNIFTLGNDSFKGTELTSNDSTSGLGGTYSYKKKENSRPEEFYNRGRANRFTHLIEGLSESDSGYHTVSPSSDAYSLASMTHENGHPETSSVIMKTHSTYGNKWIHVQSFGAVFEKGMHRRVIDELMHGFNRTRQNYSENFTVSENGTYKVEVEDFSGNKTIQEITISNIDKTAPTLDATFNNSITNNSVLIEVRGIDTQSGVKRIKLPNGNYVSSDRIEFTVNSNGTYTFECEDNVGNTTVKTVTVSNIDKTPPTVNFNIKYNTDKSSATLNVKATDNESGLKKLTNWKNEVFNNGSYTGEIPVRGNYFFIATDLAGNETVTNINVDEIISKHSSGIKDIQYRLLGATTKDWSIYNNTFTVTDEGVTHIEAKATDIAGNRSSIKTLITQIDKTSPDYTYSVTYDDSKSLAFVNVSVTDLLSGVKHIVDKDGNIINSSNLSFTVDKNGQYLIFSTDNASNIGIHSILVDGLLGGDASSGIKEIQYKLEGSTLQDWSIYNSPFKISNEGTTILTARAFDNAGNVSNETKLEIKIDKTKPANNQMSIKVL